MPNRFPYKREYQFPYGAGSVEFKKRHGDRGSDVPVAEHSYRGFKLTPGTEQNAYKWSISPEEKEMSLPKSLAGLWTDVASCEGAIDAFWAQEERRNEGNQV
jgi:hypothetical protein